MSRARFLTAWDVLVLPLLTLPCTPSEVRALGSPVVGPHTAALALLGPLPRPWIRDWAGGGVPFCQPPGPWLPPLLSGPNWRGCAGRIAKMGVCGVCVLSPGVAEPATQNPPVCKKWWFCFICGVSNYPCVLMKMLIRNNSTRALELGLWLEGPV